MLANLITELQSFGLHIASNANCRKVGAGPAEGGTIIVQGIAAHVPFSGSFISKSPYQLSLRNGESWLVKNGTFILPARVRPKPSFYDYSTHDGIPYSKLALIHGRDCIASTVRQSCVYWNSSGRCKFCGIELSLAAGLTTAVKSPSQMAEVVCKAKELDGVEHVVLTTGALAFAGSEIDYLAKCSTQIKEACDLPIHAQFLPPDDLKKLNLLRSAGVDTVGIHIESFDLRVLNDFAPVKAAIGMDRYEKAWRSAVEVFGFNQVSSFLLVGLSEQEDSVISGSEYLAKLGVYPFVVPFRPIPGSSMEGIAPPDCRKMKRIYNSVSEIIAQHGLSASLSKAGCVRCGACSALQAYEMENVRKVICRPAVGKEEVSAALAIREDVFVKEQKLFEESDLDENDSISTHIVVLRHNQIVGTVRVYPEDSEGNNWIGGRLAVLRQYRDNHVGELLVKEAMRFVKARACKRFTALIQVQNVDYFMTLGWHVISPVTVYNGKAHKQMEADLNTV